METALHHQYLLRRPLYRSSSSLPTQHPLQQQNVSSGKPMRYPTLQRITTSPIIISHHPKLFFLNTTTFKNTTMADESKKKIQSGNESSTLIINKQDAEKPSEKSQPIPPPPPEKPLPGDCCGSGCVRCVWDVYYEELEDYNNLYGSKLDFISNPKSS